MPPSSPKPKFGISGAWVREGGGGVGGTYPQSQGSTYRGTYAHFFLRCGLDCFVFFSIYFLILSPPPLPLTIGLTQTCIAIDVSPPPPPPPHWNLNKAPRGRRGNAKLIVRNKVFECTTLLKIGVIEYGKMSF